MSAIDITDQLSTLTEVIERAIDTQIRLHDYYTFEYPYDSYGGGLGEAIDALVRQPGKLLRERRQAESFSVIDPTYDSPEASFKLVVLTDLKTIGVVSKIRSLSMTTAISYGAEDYARIALESHHMAGLPKQYSSFNSLMEFFEELASVTIEPVKPPTRKQVRDLLRAQTGLEPTATSVRDIVASVKDRIRNPQHARYLDSLPKTDPRQSEFVPRIPKDGSVPSKKEMAAFIFRQSGVWPTSQSVKNARRQAAITAARLKVPED